MTSILMMSLLVDPVQILVLLVHSSSGRKFRCNVEVKTKKKKKNKPPKNCKKNSLQNSFIVPYIAES